MGAVTEGREEPETRKWSVLSEGEARPPESEWVNLSLVLLGKEWCKEVCSRLGEQSTDTWLSRMGLCVGTGQVLKGGA